MSRLDDIRARVDGLTLFPQYQTQAEHDRQFLLDLVDRAVPLVEEHTQVVVSRHDSNQWLDDVRGEVGT
jgi:hypothetical protein